MMWLLVSLVNMWHATPRVSWRLSKRGLAGARPRLPAGLAMGFRAPPEACLGRWIQWQVWAWKELSVVLLVFGAPCIHVNAIT